MELTEKTSEKLDFLEKAANAGEIIKVKYYGGSHSGETREITPRKIEGDKLRAYCCRDGVDKQFFIDKLAILNEAGETIYNEHIISDFDILENLYNTHKLAWEQADWYVAFDTNSIKLHKKKKDGTPRKNPELFIGYDSSLGGKPWYASGGQYKYMDKAILRFLEVVSNYPPK